MKFSWYGIWETVSNQRVLFISYYSRSLGMNKANEYGSSISLACEKYAVQGNHVSTTRTRETKGI